MENMACAGCGAEIVIDVNTDNREFNFTGGTMLRCDKCGHMFFLSNFNPDSIKVTGAQKVLY